MPPPNNSAGDHATDPSGAPERTRLSWRRTSLTLTAAAILLLRLALQHPNRALAIIVSALTALAWVMALMLIHSRVRALPATLTSAGPLVLTTLGCLFLGVLGVVLIAL
ncbi:MAG TPA: DUF202 domain-containing protein [Gemmatimonadales bacterium]|nr:DUF202 domain-containing protein [Gemmatimonadales bacterium]